VIGAMAERRERQLQGQGKTTMSDSRCVLITGGAGFVGTNVAKRLLANGVRVRIFDSLARAGSEQNVAWLCDAFRDAVEFVRGDVRERNALAAALDGVDHVYHFAAQVAVTTSLLDPSSDFEVNARGTLNLLEAARACARPPSILYSSTNKVYGGLADIEVQPIGDRYVPTDERVRASGIGETRSLDFHSPYGCSKGAADQYVLDYARSFGLQTVVMRMSCIYGPHQHGNEDQGWVAHFARRALADMPVTVYGDGRQVRDVLFVEDLVDAFELARANIDELSGCAFNLGGGTQNTMSVKELVQSLERITGRRMQVSMDEWRVGDQRYYVSDIARFCAATGWRPRVNVTAGLNALCEWFEGHEHSVPPLTHAVREHASMRGVSGEPR
jgi:CDP-paratose 2-epimerase